MEPLRRSDRLRLWEVECALLDAALALSLDGAELLRCCRAAGVEAPAGSARRVLVALHRACHQDTPVARALERRLDTMHCSQIEALGPEEMAALAARMLDEDMPALPQLAGAVWAIATSRQPETAAVRRYLASALALDGLRLIALQAATTGRVERTLEAAPC